MWTRLPSGQQRLQIREVLFPEKEERQFDDIIPASGQQRLECILFVPRHANDAWSKEPMCRCRSLTVDKIEVSPWASATRRGFDQAKGQADALPRRCGQAKQASWRARGRRQLPRRRSGGPGTLAAMWNWERASACSIKGPQHRSVPHGRRCGRRRFHRR